MTSSMKWTWILHYTANTQSLSYQIYNMSQFFQEEVPLRGSLILASKFFSMSSSPFLAAPSSSISLVVGLLVGWLVGWLVCPPLRENVTVVKVVTVVTKHFFHQLNFSQKKPFFSKQKISQKTFFTKQLFSPKNFLHRDIFFTKKLFSY